MHILLVRWLFRNFYPSASIPIPNDTHPRKPTNDLVVESHACKYPHEFPKSTELEDGY